MAENTAKKLTSKMTATQSKNNGTVGKNGKTCAGTETEINIARAFAGECQASARYKFLADTLRKEGYVYLQEQLTALASEEDAHAKVFWDLATAGMKAQMKNLVITADYPYFKGCPCEELAFSAKCELDENTKIYPAFMAIAKKEGCADAELKFRQIIEVEGAHYAKLSQIATLLKEETLYRKNTPVKWRCTNCGHTETAREAWNACPLCGAPQGMAMGMLSQQ